METMFGWSIMFWMVFLITIMLIGGFFMFRKFLKSMPKKDGKSTLDWQDHYIEKSLHLWTEEGKALLNELVSPVPSLFRDVAKNKIAAQIGELALQEGAKEITKDHIIRGYILATPKRDYKYLTKRLQQLKIDATPYENLLK